jgi:hypothetical protein
MNEWRTMNGGLQRTGNNKKAGNLAYILIAIGRLLHTHYTVLQIFKWKFP